MWNARLAMATCLICGFGWSSSLAAAAAATDLMGGVPSVAELVDALTPVRQQKTRGIKPSGEVAIEPSRPAVDLEVRFEFDSYDLTPMGRAVLDNLATALTTDLAPYRFVFEGHTDAVGGDVYNQRLSERRAQAVRRYLRELYRIDEARMTVIGKGERELLLPDQPTAAPNRRVRVINRG